MNAVIGAGTCGKDSKGAKNLFIEHHIRTVNAAVDNLENLAIDLGVYFPEPTRGEEGAKLSEEPRLAQTLIETPSRLSEVADRINRLTDTIRDSLI